MAPGQPQWSLALWFECMVTLTLLASLAMYLHAFHERDSRRSARGEQNGPGPDDLQQETGAGSRGMS